MIEALKKYPRTYKKFKQYMSKFNVKERNGATFTFEGDELDVYDDNFNIPNFHEVFKLPTQMLIGCLMEFLGENRINISIHSSIVECVLLDIDGDQEAIIHPNRTSAFTKAFAILEERE